jgi:uncharacterized protein (TIGR00645 family)
MEASTDIQPRNRAITVAETVLFNVKWLLIPFYLGLVPVMLVYGYAYLRGIIDVIAKAPSLSTESMMLLTLDFVDMVMVANLIKMIITGSYNSFVSKHHGRPNENISSGTLKIKISTSIITVGAIHLLREFEADELHWSNIQIKLGIFAAFLGTTLVLGILEYLHIKGLAVESRIQSQQPSG